MATEEEVYQAINADISEMRAKLESSISTMQATYVNDLPFDIEDFERIPSAPYISSSGISDDELNNVKLAAVAAPDISSFTPPSFWSTHTFDKVETYLYNWLETSGVGISDERQDAIFRKDAERTWQATEDALDLAGARTGARGFFYPTSMTKAAQAEILEKYRFDMIERGRSITNLIAELAQKNVQFSVEAINKNQNVVADYAVRFSALYQTMISNMIDLYKAKVSAAIAELESKVKVYTARADIAKSNAQVQIAAGELKVEEWKALMNESTERTKARIAQIERNTELTMEALKSIADRYGSLLGSLTGSYINVIK